MCENVEMEEVQKEASSSLVLEKDHSVLAVSGLGSVSVCAQSLSFHDEEMTGPRLCVTDCSRKPQSCFLG